MVAGRARTKDGRGVFARLFPSREAWGSTGRWSLRGLFAALLVLAVWGSIRVRTEVRADERFHLNSWRLELAELPEWVTPEIRGEIEAVTLGGVPEVLSLFDPGVLEKVRQVFLASPWIRGVGRIEARYPTFERPGVLGITLRLRRPVALVEHGGLFYLTDEDCRRLGPPYAEAPTAWFGAPVVAGAPSPGTLAAPGEKWASRDLEQGIEVAKVLFENGILRDYPERPIERIDLSNLHGRVSPRDSEVVLVCGAQRLSWGRSPISAGARTASVSQVVANLRFVLSHPDKYANLAVIHLHRNPDALTGVRG